MKKLLFICLGICIISLTSCDKMKDAKNVVTEFYNNQKSKDFNKSISLLSKSTIEMYSEEDIVNEFSRVLEVMGNLKSYKFVGFEMKTNDGKEYIKLNYTSEYENGKCTETFEMIKENDAYKINYWKWTKE
mgnify:CR=1 FL=1